MLGTMAASDDWTRRAATLARTAAGLSRRAPLGWRLALKAAPTALRLGKLALASAPARVRGRSMEPTLFDGDLVAIRPPALGEPHVGQIVVAWTGEREVIKRVAAIDDSGIRLRGDNKSATTDPAPLPAEAIRGVVILRYWPPMRSL